MIAAKTKYKKSEIDWMPEVPDNWTLKRGNWVFDLGKEIVTKEQLQSIKSLLHYSIPSIQETGNPTHENGNTIDSNKQIVSPGDLLVSKLNPRKKTIVIVNQDEENRLLVASTEFVNLKCKDVNTRFAFYLYQSHLVTERITSTVQSSTNSHQRAYPDTIFKMWNYFPPIEEQKAITEYLDAKCEKITRFIQTKKRFIELLKEQKQSIIINAVTKGIDDQAKLKATVLCEIPEHWEVKRLKFLAEVNFSTVDKHSHKEEKQVRLCNYVDVYKHEYITNDFDFMNATATEAEIKRFTVEKGDVIITKDSETAADIAIPALVVEDLENVVCAYHLAHIKPNSELIESEFLFRLFQSKKINSHFEVAAKGVTRHGLSYDDINSVFLPYPPTLKEQQDIIKHIKTESRTLDIAISKAEREIELIKEYREAMIAEAVTGKIKL